MYIELGGSDVTGASAMQIEVVSGVLLMYGEIDTAMMVSGNIDIVVKETLGTALLSSLRLKNRVRQGLQELRPDHRGSCAHQDVRGAWACSYVVTRCEDVRTVGLTRIGLGRHGSNGGGVARDRLELFLADPSPSKGRAPGESQI